MRLSTPDQEHVSNIWSTVFQSDKELTAENDALLMAPLQKVWAGLTSDHQEPSPLECTRREYGSNSFEMNRDFCEADAERLLPTDLLSGGSMPTHPSSFDGTTATNVAAPSLCIPPPIDTTFQYLDYLNSQMGPTVPLMPAPASPDRDVAFDTLSNSRVYLLTEADLLNFVRHVRAAEEDSTHNSEGSTSIKPCDSQSVESEPATGFKQQLPPNVIGKSEGFLGVRHLLNRLLELIFLVTSFTYHTESGNKQFEGDSPRLLKGENETFDLFKSYFRWNDCRESFNLLGKTLLQFVCVFLGISVDPSTRHTLLPPVPTTVVLVISFFSAMVAAIHFDFCSDMKWMLATTVLSLAWGGFVQLREFYAANNRYAEAYALRRKGKLLSCTKRRVRKPLTATVTTPSATTSSAAATTAAATTPVTAATTPITAGTTPITAETTPVAAATTPVAAATTPVTASGALLSTHSTTPLTVHSTTPLMAHSTTPLIAHSTTPLMAHSTTPLMAHSTTPLMAHSTTPLMAHSTTPLMAHSTTPLSIPSTTPPTAHLTTLACNSSGFSASKTGGTARSTISTAAITPMGDSSSRSSVGFTSETSPVVFIPEASPTTAKTTGFLDRIKGPTGSWSDENRSATPSELAISDEQAAVDNTNGSTIAPQRLKFGVRDPETVHYSILIKGCAQQRQVEKALQLFDEMVRRGIQCNEVTYNTLVNACISAGELDKALDIVHRMEEHDAVKPDVITYSTLIKGYCAIGKVERAIEILRRMTDGRVRVKPDAILYNTLLEGCSKRNLVELAEELLAEMMAVPGISPSSFTLTIMVKLYGRTQRLSQALALAEELPRRFNVEFDAYVCTSLIAACLLNGNLDQALIFFEQMNANEVTRASVSGRTFGTVIIGCLKARRIFRACALLAEGTARRVLMDPAVVNRVTQGLHALRDAVRTGAITEDSLRKPSLCDESSDSLRNGPAWRMRQLTGDPRTFTFFLEDLSLWVDEVQRRVRTGSELGTGCNNRRNGNQRNNMMIAPNNLHDSNPVRLPPVIPRDLWDISIPATVVAYSTGITSNKGFCAAPTPGTGVAVQEKKYLLRDNNNRSTWSNKNAKSALYSGNAYRWRDDNLITQHPSLESNITTNEFSRKRNNKPDAVYCQRNLCQQYEAIDTPYEAIDTAGHRRHQERAALYNDPTPVLARPIRYGPTEENRAFHADLIPSANSNPRGAAAYGPSWRNRNYPPMCTNL